jgi:hypothetical protein
MSVLKYITAFPFSEINQIVLKFCAAVKYLSRSEWPRDLRHESSSHDPTLRSWVQIPLETWMSACVYSMFCVVLWLCDGLIPIQGVLLTVYIIKKLEKRPESKGL